MPGWVNCMYFWGYGRLHANYAKTNYLKPISDKGVLLMLALVITRVYVKTDKSWRCADVVFSSLHMRAPSFSLMSHVLLKKAKSAKPSRLGGLFATHCWTKSRGLLIYMDPSRRARIKVLRWICYLYSIYMQKFSSKCRRMHTIKPCTLSQLVVFPMRDLNWFSHFV